LRTEAPLVSWHSLGMLEGSWRHDEVAVRMFIRQTPQIGGIWAS